MTATAAKSIAGFISEQDRAPYGVIFDGTKKAYVGSPHGQPIPLSANLKRKLRALANQNGVWFEGDGKDVMPNRALFGAKSDYQGSWDDALAKTVDGYPYYFLSPLFGNVSVNGPAKAFVDPSISIFESLIKNQSGMRYFSDRSYKASDLQEFFSAVSDQKYNFFKMAQGKATAANLASFLKAGEAQMFPSNWQSYPHNAGKVMKKFEDARNLFVLNQPKGVFVMGAGHLVEIKRLRKSLSMIGGERAAE